MSPNVQVTVAHQLTGIERLLLSKQKKADLLIAESKLRQQRREKKLIEVAAADALASAPAISAETSATIQRRADNARCYAKRTLKVGFEHCCCCSGRL